MGGPCVDHGRLAAAATEREFHKERGGDGACDLEHGLGVEVSSEVWSLHRVNLAAGKTPATVVAGQRHFVWDARDRV